MKRRSRLPSTVSKQKPPKRAMIGRLPHVKRPGPLPPKALPARRDVARIIDEGEKSLVDVLDSLLNQGVVLNADLILALANVDLVYVRLSALLCSADRVMPKKRG